MKVNNINTKVFLEGLEVVGNAIPTKHAIVSLANVLIKFEEDRIVLLGSDGNTSIKKVLFCEDNNDFVVAETGVALIDYKILKPIVSKLDSQKFNIEVINNYFVIKTEKGRYRLAMLNHSDYPNIDFKRLENEISLPTQTLRDIIKYTSFSCSTNDKRPILTGVNFKVENNELIACSTDSFRFSQFSKKLEEDRNENVVFTFPKNSLLVLEKLINKTKKEEIVLLYDSNNEVLINVDDTLYKTRMLVGIYPSLKSILDMISKPLYTCTVDRDALYSSIEIVNIFNSNDYNIVTLSFDNNGFVEITNKNSEVGNGKRIIECPNCNFNLKVSCSSNYLLDSLKCYDSEEVEINLLDTLKPFTITSKSNENLLELLLPVKSE